MESRVTACMRGRQAARARIGLAMQTVKQARAELAGTAAEERAGVWLSFLDLQMALALKALSTPECAGTRGTRLRPGGGAR